MSESSSYSDDCSSEESNEDFIDNFNKAFSKLKPYEFEPILSSDEESDSDKGEEEEEQRKEIVQERTGKKDWCLCDCCEVMESEIESLCCQETNEIGHDLSDNKCVTLSKEYQTVCLELSVLKTALAAMSNENNYENNNLRFAAYKQYIYWIYSRLGKHVRRVIPSCVVWNIRRKYPSEDGNYVPFKFSRYF